MGGGLAVLAVTVNPPSQAWIGLVIAGAIRSVGHIREYFADKKTIKKQASTIQAQQDSIDAQAARTDKMILTSNPVKSAPKAQSAVSASSFVPLAALGAVAIVGLAIMRRK
jgi:hypothetical protein